jgi:GNAT superfamily N-acetyltransferase
LWLLKLENSIAAYGWAVLGRTIEPHFFPLAANDAHLFDFFVFPEFRGRRLNPALVNHILVHLACETSGRAFIEAARWNQPQLASLARLPFRKLGCARKFQLLGRTIVMWRLADP